MKFERCVIYYIIIVYSVILYFFVNDKTQYVPMLAIMYVSPFLLLLKFFKVIQKGEYLIYITALNILMTYVWHAHEFRLNTVAYSLMFISTYLYYIKVLNKRFFSLEDYFKLLSFIIKAYAIVLVTQQLSVIAHIPVFNQCWEFSENRFKLNSLSIEPSNTSLIVTVIMFSLVKIRELRIGRKYNILQDYKNEKFQWISYFYIQFTSGSLAAIFAVLVFLMYMIEKKYIFRCLIFLFIVGMVAVFFINDNLLNRISILLPAIMTFDVNYLYNIDASSSARIAPYILYFRDFNLFDINTWVGYGCDYGKTYLTIGILGYLPDDDQGVGGVINFLYDYGLISTIPMFIYIYKLSYSKYKFDFILYLLLFTIVPFNHYVTWIYMILIFTNWYFFAKSNLSLKVHKNENGIH